ncbi:CorA family divalent cation transporter [Micromonospora gifhornensis]|uniref:CorA family divalent cation transporter n=1 Tax=Micromonospora gifhornensis TaxID=84594 RepID=UPI003D7078F9
MSSLATCELRVTRNDQELRLVTGARAEIERRNRTLLDTDNFRHEVLGAGWISDGTDLAAMVAAGADGWDLEIGEPGPATTAALRLLLADLLPAGAVDELAALADGLRDEPMPWHAEWIPPVPPALAREGAAWFDVLAPSVNWRQDDTAADPVAHYRHARIIWAPRWCVVVWSGRTGGEGSKYRTWGLPDRRLEDQSAGGSGAERMARVLRAVVRHIEWSVDMVDLELETWENYFLAQAAGDGGLFVGPDFNRLQRHLALLGHGTALNRDAVRTLVRRIEIQPGIPGDVRDLVREKCERFLSQSQAQRRAVRQSFDLIANATSGQQFRLAQERADRDGAFQAIVGILAAVFVAPALIAAFYGANVKGLPGADAREGLWYMLLGSVLAGLISVCLILVVRARSRRPRS